jgi:hypothetical protein
MAQRWNVAALAVVAVLVSASAQAQNAWVHVRASQGSGENVAVNLPLSVVEAVLRAAPEQLVENGRVRIPENEAGLSIADLRTVWTELSAAGDAEFVTMRDGDQVVRVARRGDQIQVRVTGDDGEAVTVDVPMRMIDALLSGDGETLDVEAAIRELRTIRGDVVNVRGDDDENVRVWIDESAS